jgi:hypothetical protein
MNTISRDGNVCGIDICISCRQVVAYDLTRVMTITCFYDRKQDKFIPRPDGDRQQPICPTCMENVNILLRERNLPEMEYEPGAYFETAVPRKLA